jgi:LacI family transcriptional regulator
MEEELAINPTFGYLGGLVNKDTLKLYLILDLHHAYFQQIIMGAHRYVWAHQSKIVIHSSPSGSVTSFIEQASNIEGPVGVILPLRRPEVEQQVRNCTTRVVNISNYTPENLGTPLVTNDDDAVGVLAAEHFFRRGFRSFAFVGDENVAYSRQRLKGYRRRLRELAGSPVEVSTFEKDGWEPDDFLEGRGECQSAVFAANDFIAHNLALACLKEGIKIPQQVSILGVDNDPLLTSLLPVRLSSIQLDSVGIGQRACMALLSLDDASTQCPEPVYLKPLHVVERESTEEAGFPDALVRRAINEMKANLHKPYTIDELLFSLQVSRRNLENRFQAAIGVSPRQHLISLKIDHCRLLARQTFYPVEQLANLCGYAEPKGLRKAFKQETGMTISEYRERF